ncbi:acyl-CoA dehydrogenase family protein [Streptomyces sp. NPDC007325]|uniref:acyl-CoA dehydrogenase family protein n=1 Tax=unclassified Streptomyces TaxID=2593676 RepID=UPI0033DDF63E
MRLLSTERALLDQVLPGFDARLAEWGTAAAEDPRTGAVDAFRAAGGGNLLIPAALGGAGLGCRDGVRLQRAVGSRAPSLAVASTMHHYKVAWLARCGGPAAGAVLRRIAAERHLVASCGAEGTVGKNVFTPGIDVVAAPGGLLVSGTKQPCSLTRSLGLMSLSAAGPAGGPYAGQLLMLMLPVTEGVERRPFWGNRVLRATETDALVLDRAFVPDEMIVPLGDPAASPWLFTSNLLWFQLLITAAYLGIATGHVERLFTGERGAPGDRVAALAPLETVAAALDALAADLDAAGDEGAAPAGDPGGDDALGRALLVRYTAQRAIAEATDRALEIEGGMPFVSGGPGSELLLASRALTFHPPAETAVRDRLDQWLRGGGLTLV